jgi:hypothetical protein
MARRTRSGDCGRLEAIASVQTATEWAARSAARSTGGEDIRRPMDAVAVQPGLFDEEVAVPAERALDWSVMSPWWPHAAASGPAARARRARACNAGCCATDADRAVIDASPTCTGDSLARR